MQVNYRLDEMRRRGLNPKSIGLAQGWRGEWKAQGLLLKVVRMEKLVDMLGRQAGRAVKLRGSSN